MADYFAIRGITCDSLSAPRSCDPGIDPQLAVCYEANPHHNVIFTDISDRFVVVIAVRHRGGDSKHGSASTGVRTHKQFTTTLRIEECAKIHCVCSFLIGLVVAVFCFIGLLIKCCCCRKKQAGATGADPSVAAAPAPFDFTATNPVRFYIQK